MARKDIQNDGIYAPAEIGSNIYLWSNPKEGGKRACVITAHGTQNTALVSKGSPAKKATIYFYCPHGSNLSDSTSMGIMRGQTKHFQKVAPGGSCHDYILTKAQGDHDAKGKENYANIQKGWHPSTAREVAYNDFVANSAEALARSPKLGGGLGGSAQKQALKDYLIQWEQAAGIVVDVVTIRNRLLPHLRNTVTLFNTVKLLEDSGYTAIHCFFCRGSSAESPIHGVSSNVMPFENG